ncbi:MAG TPA: biopolymer transporter ExbD [bacterium]|nr:biopolymer transporter ExbD [bacterium]
MVKKRKQVADEDINLTPAMNLILILIPLLLTAMETIKMTTINVATPQIGPSSEAQPPEDRPEDKPLKLTVALTDRGITLFARDQVIENKDDPLGPTIPKIDGEEESVVDGTKTPGKVYDYNKLAEMLADIKAANPAEENIIITAESNTKYHYIIKIMDAARERKDGDKKTMLFPNVVLSAGVA